MINLRGFTLLTPMETKRVAGELVLAQALKEACVESNASAAESMLALVQLNNFLGQALVSIPCECAGDPDDLCPRCEGMQNVRAQMEEHGLWDG